MMAQQLLEWWPVLVRESLARGSAVQRAQDRLEQSQKHWAFRG
jgi:hypothetical protein